MARVRVYSGNPCPVTACPTGQFCKKTNSGKGNNNSTRVAFFVPERAKQQQTRTGACVACTCGDGLAQAEGESCAKQPDGCPACACGSGLFCSSNSNGTGKKGKGKGHGHGNGNSDVCVKCPCTAEPQTAGESCGDLTGVQQAAQCPPCACAAGLGCAARHNKRDVDDVEDNKKGKRKLTVCCCA